MLNSFSSPDITSVHESLDSDALPGFQALAQADLAVV